MKTLFCGGKILTMEDGLYCDAVLVENGKINDVGNESEIRSKVKGFEEINLNGAVLMPAFIDPHSHFFQMAISLLQVSLDGADSVFEIKKRISDFILKNGIKSGQWINVRDYDNNIMPGYKNPSIDELDSVCPDNPLVIHHKSGHMGLFNSKGLEALGITADTPSPEGGKIGKENGRLTGYLEENALFENINRIPLPDIGQLLNAVTEAQKIYASYGIVTVQDGMVTEQLIPLYEILAEKHMMNLDVVLYTSPEAYELGMHRFNSRKKSRIKVGGIKIFLDGSPQGRTAWMRKPYSDSADYCAYSTMKDEDVEEAFRFAAEHNTQLIAHCNGDAAAEQFLRCLEKSEQKYGNLKNLRPVIIHGQLMGRDQLYRAKKLNAMISFFIAHIYHWGDVHLRNFGKERADFISPAKSAVNNGIKITFHQDSPVIQPDMFETVSCAVNRITKNGKQLAESERISTYEALKCVTVNSAYQYFQENITGSINIGKNADFVILDRNPLETDNSDIKNIKVLKTYKNGKCIYSRQNF